MSRWIVRARPRVLASGLLSSALLVSGLLATAGPASAVVPSSPTAVVASWSGPNLAVSWQHPGGAGISYRADVFDIAVGGAAVASASTASKSTTVTGLTKGTRYWVSVVAIEDATADTSPPSTRTAVPGVPDAPTIDSVRAGNASARVTWSAPASDGGSSITRYIARAYDANPGGTEVGSCEPASLTTLTCVIPGLANGADAWISVTAENAVGVGPASARVKVTPGALPSAPQSVTVTALDGALRVAWSAPDSDGGNAITGYTAYAYAASVGGAATATCTPVPATGTTCDIPALVNGTEVFVAVAATTAVGEGDESTPRTAGTPGLVPGAPTDVTADPRDRSAVVYWSPPASNGGLAITNYIVRAYDTVTGGSVKRTCTTATVGCTLTTLTNGTSYWVEVVAENAIGAGSPSTPRVEVRPKTVAGAPGAVSVSAGDRRAEIRWAAPTASLNGQRIIGYEARAFNSSTFGSPLASCRTTASGTASPTTFCTITGLTNGWDYYVDVVAQTEAGDGPASSPRVKFVPSTLPAPPLRVTAVRAAGGVSVSWDQPPSGGTVITKFTARAYSQESGGSALANCSTSALSCTIAGIDGRTEVYVDVTAANAIGEGTASAPRVGVELGSAPGSPRWVVGSPRQRSVKVSWAPPVWSGNKPVTGYQARAWSAATAGSELGSCQATAPATACTIGSLTAGSTVFVEVAARSDLGVGVPSARTGIRIVQGRPSVPREVSAFAAPRRIAVFWAPPASDGGRPLTEATAYAWNAAGDELQGSCTVRGSALRAGAMCVIDGLRPAQVLSVHVIASSADGEGPQSDAVRVITRPGPPAPPQGIGISPRDGALAVHWTAPEFDGGSPVTGYIVRAWSQAQAGTVLEACQTDAGDTDCTLGGLRNGATYFIDVLAENAFGTSPSAGRTPASVASEMPAEPSGVNVVPADAALLIRWDNAAGTLNSTVTGYRARAYLKRTGGAVVGECTAAKEGSCTIGGLRNGVVYWIAVEAQNAGGYGDPSNPRIRKAPVA